MDAPRGILYWFRVTAVPEGGAPVEIREQWVGALLPVRQPPPIEGPESYVGRDVMNRRVVNRIPDGVAVEPDDALRALRWFAHDEVAQWWEDLLRAHPRRVASLVFRRCEGDLLPVRMAYMLHPDLESFDSYDGW